MVITATVWEGVVMLVELGIVEQRYRAVREVLEDGATITDVAARHGITRQTVHRWLRTYTAAGLPGLANHSTRPRGCPHQMSLATEKLIVELRELHPDWGPRTIRWHLLKRMDDPPTRSSIYRALVRRGLISPEKRPRRRKDYRRWERERPMELWQMDVMGHVRLADGTYVSVVTGIDDHSRYCVIARLVQRATAEPVCAALLHGLQVHGIPEAILTDNGKVFTGRFTSTKTIVRFDHICRENGIRHILTAPYSPTTTGKIERLHRTMRREFFEKHVFATIEEAQAALDIWVQTYNAERPHQSIGDVVPGERFARQLDLSEVQLAPQCPDSAPLARPAGVMRWVDASGRIGVAGYSYTIGKVFAGEPVEVLAHDKVIDIFHNSILVSTLARKGNQRPSVLPPGRISPHSTGGNTVKRLADQSGGISFAGTYYRVGRMYRGREIGVALANDCVHLSVDGIVVRVHPARHDPRKEHSAFAQAKGRGHYRRPAAS